MTNTTNSLVDTYIAAFNEADPQRRRDLVARSFTEDGTYLDPLMSGEGHDGIDAMIAGAQQQFPGHRFVLAGAPDAHNDRVRFTWHLRPDAGADVVAVGIDFGTVAADGRLTSITGFLEPGAAAA
jgi:SnoaL-like domain